MSTSFQDCPTVALAAVDLFCGAGGLTHGLQLAGVDVRAGFDVDPDCRFPYEQNNNAEFVESDVRQVTSRAVESWFGEGEFRALAGCAPCQPFSTYGRPKRASDDRKWELLREFGRLVVETNPHLVTMENVPQLADHPVLREFLSVLRGYHVWSDLVDCADLGVPQSRKRLVLLASRLGPISLQVQSTRREVTVRDTIASLKPLSAGASDPDDPLHVACKLSQLNMARIRASSPGGSWRDWPEALRSPCHIRATGETFPSVYGRMEWDTAAPTITTQCFGFGNGRFGHPSQDRAITLREAAMLQTFPRRYAFVKPGYPVRFSTLGRLIGNAVPVRLGEILGRCLREHVRRVTWTAEGPFLEQTTKPARSRTTESGGHGRVSLNNRN